MVMSSERTVKVLYFAAASTATGLSSELITLPPQAAPEPFRLSSLASLLTSRHPDTVLGKVLEGSQWSVDAEMVEDPEKVILRGGEEIAVICPVSGG